MSSSSDDNQDWENFRFPSRPAPVLQEPEEEDDEEGEGGGDAAQMDLRLRRGSWEYRAESRSICSVDLGKLIRLDEVDQVQKIVRLLVLLEERTDYDVDSLIDALEAASLDCYGHDLNQVLADHRWGVKIQWKPLISEEINSPELTEKNDLKSRYSVG